MDFADFSQDYMLIAAAATCFVAGVVFARVVFSRSGVARGEDPRNHLIRQLEADLRLAERKLEDFNEQLETKVEEFDQSLATVRDLNQLLAERDQEVEGLRGEIKSEVAKTRELRRELTDRAEETLRQHVRAEEAKTELAIAKAGSDAIMSEFSRLQGEEQKNQGSDQRVQADNEKLLDETYP